MSEDKYLSKSVSNNFYQDDITFDSFKYKLIAELSNMLGDGYVVTVKEVNKNNGKAHGVSIEAAGAYGDRNGETESDEVPDWQMSPIYYIDGMYMDYVSGDISPRFAAKLIAEEYGRLDTSMLRHMSSAADGLYDFEQAQEKLCIKVVNTELNKELLEIVPHVDILDLSIVFYYVFETYERGFSGTIITYELMKDWKTDVNELYRLAVENGRRMMLPLLRDIAQVRGRESGPDAEFFVSEEVIRLPRFSDKEKRVPSIYILTNSMTAQGSAEIFYDGILKRCADAIGGDLYILPSSVHEILLLPLVPEIGVDKLETMVREVNRTEVSERDFLSNNVYRYYADNNSIGFARGGERICINDIHCA